MAELNLKQITDKLNSEFTGEVRKLVFWYDANAEFAEDVDGLELVNAKVLHLAPDNQFYTKYFLECEDTTTNYLVYAPFAKPAIRDNHLADTLRYSREFCADRASLLVLDLGIDERYKSYIQKYIKFFGDKKRTQAFYDLELDTFTPATIELGLMCVLCKCKTPSYEELLRVVLTDAGFEDNPHLAELDKYGLQEAFWQQAAGMFGYADENPTLEKLTLMMFVTYAAKAISAELPSAWRPFVSFKSGNVIAFLDNLMNSYVYGDRFDEISSMAYAKLRGEHEFGKLSPEALVSCEIFAGVDEILLRWITERLKMEDVAAKLGVLTIPELAQMRRQTHFGRQRADEYMALENAWNVISNSRYVPSHSLNELVTRYTGSLYRMDRWCREYYYHLDKLEDSGRYEELTELVENIYSNDYLAEICYDWTDSFRRELDSLEIGKQVEFFSRNVQYAKDQVVVIISDALRYEVGVSLLERLEADEKCMASIKVMASTLPAITSYGMAALLPNRSRGISGEYKLLIDGKKSDSLEQRQAILQSYKPNSRCVQYDAIKNMSVAELRSIFNRQDVVYVYHDQIDARGDKRVTENEVFNACEEAVEEIRALIRRLTTSANKSHFIVTADHGFIYKRRKLEESDKIGLLSGAAEEAGRRHFFGKNDVVMDGVMSVPVGVMLKNDDERMISCPVSTEIFKTRGGAFNYVHGGCSPQEMLVPVIDVKTEKSYRETSNAQIALVSLVTKITNLITVLDFVQTEPVSDVVKETAYRIYFVDGAGEKISSEHIFTADKKDADTQKRMFRLKFTFKNKSYSRIQKYYLVAFDDNTGLEAMRHEIIMDIAFADDFGFGF